MEAKEVKNEGAVVMNDKDVQNAMKVAPMGYVPPIRMIPPTVAKPVGSDANNEQAASRNLIDSSRLGFIRKVYSLLMVQLALTALITFITFKVTAVQTYFLYNMPVFWSMLALWMFTYYVITCYPKTTYYVPWNYIILFLYTFSQAYFVAFVCAASNPRIVCAAALLTAAMVAGLTAYACFTKHDFTMCGVFLCAGSFILVGMIFVGIFITNKFFHAALSAACILGSALYIIYITQLICGDKSSEFSIDDYIPAAFLIYTEIINIFLEVLKLLGPTLCSLLK